MDGEGVEVDDLFGDTVTLDEAAALELPLHTIQAEGFAQHLDDLHRASTERKRVAWSRLGCIASLSSDSPIINIRHLHSSGTENGWSLSDEQSIDLTANGDLHHPLLQLEWNHFGTDLAVADAAGRITIINISQMAMNETSVVRPAHLDREDELNQVLAMCWLNVDRPSPTFIHASKLQDEWTYVSADRRPMGPFSTSGLFVVTRKGTMILHYARPDGRWASSRAESSSLIASDRLLTHAAVASTKENKLLVVAQNTDCQLLVDVVTLDMPDLKRDSQMTSAPKISIENVRAPVPYRRSKNSNVQNSQNGDFMIFDTSSQFLSHLEIIPTSDVEKVLQLPPTILAFYTPMEASMNLVHNGPLGSTTVRRWHVVSTECKLHPNFDSAESKVGNSTPSRRIDLVRLDDIHLNQIVTAVQKVDSGENLALGSSDGSLMIYPNSLSGLYTANEPSEVSNFAQAGFIFPPYSRGLRTSISPNSCVAVSLADDDKMQLTCLDQPVGLSYDSTGSTTLEASVVAIVLAFARSFASGLSSNDIILLVHQHLDPVRWPDLIRHLLKALFSDVECIQGPEQGRVHKPVVPRILSLVAALGLDSSTERRTHASMLSWLSLNIRLHALAVINMLLLPKEKGGVDWMDSEICEMTCSNIRWTLDLFQFIVDDLFEMSDERASPFPPQPEGTGPHHEADSHLTTELILVASWSRDFLKIIPRLYRGIVEGSQETRSKLPPESRPSFLRMAAVIEASPLKMEPLEQLLVGVGKIVDHFYKTSNMTEQAQADSQRFILAHGRIPTELRDVVRMILQDVLPTTSGKIDRLSLYMVDHSWLGIRDDDARTRKFKRDFVVDVHRKTILPRKSLGKVRKCVRCGSVSGDLVRMRRRPQYLQLLRCICEDVFAVVGP